MKYCMMCGAVHVDEAVTCTKCGCMMKKPPKPTRSFFRALSAGATEEKPVSPNANLMSIFHFSFLYDALLSLFFLLMSIGLGEGAFGGCCIVALVFSILTFASSVPVFMAAVMEKKRLDQLLGGISKLLISLLLLVGAVVLLIN